MKAIWLRLRLRQHKTLCRGGVLLLLVLVLCLCNFVLSHRSVMAHFSKVFENPKYHLANIFAFLNHDFQSYIKNSRHLKPVKEISPLKTYRLVISNEHLAEIEAAIRPFRYTKTFPLPDEARPSFKAKFQTENGQWLKANVKLRGWGFWHHQMEKPSFRIKAKGALGDLNYELTRPEDALGFKNWLPSYFAEEIGLMSDRSEHVRLFVNGSYYGVYLKTSRMNAELALAFKRGLGNFYKGDSEHLWESLSAWNISGERNLNNNYIFEKFLSVLKKETNRKTLDELKKYLDFDNYARWSALMVVTGSAHTDEMHNHAYFIENLKEKIEAIPWDFNSFGIHIEADTAPDYVLHPLMRKMICDPHWVQLRNEYVYHYLKTLTAPGKFKKLVMAKFNTIKTDLMADRHLSELKTTTVAWPGVMMLPVAVTQLDDKLEEIIAYNNQRHEILMSYCDQTKLYVRSHLQKKGFSEVFVGGRIGISYRVKSKTKNKLIFPGVNLGIQDTEPAVFRYELAHPPEELEFFNAITGERVFSEKTALDDTVKNHSVKITEY